MLVALMMGVFLVAFVGFATDYTSFWFQRQSVQSAADATCQAASVDLLLYAEGASTPKMNFTPGGTPVNCSSSPVAAPCLIAAYNGFSGATSGVNVNLTFPPSGTTFPNVTPAPGVTWPYVTVDVTRQTPAFFSSLLTLHNSVNVHASATCGLVESLGAGSVLVLDPYPQIITVAFNGSGNMKLIGGSQVGMQVNADSIRAVKFNSSGAADFSLGSQSNTGSDIAITGTETDPGSTHFVRGTTGVWNSPDTSELNPYTNLSVPTGVLAQNPTNIGTLINAGTPTDGCTDATNGCIRYSPGYYPTGISYSGARTMLFDPGIYYLNGSLSVTGTATLRLGTHSQTDGVMFYFYAGTLSIGSTSGTSGTAGMVSSTQLTCDGSSPSAIFSIPSTLNGNVLSAQCTTRATYWDSYGDTGDSVGTVRGVLFFQDYNNSSTSPSLYGNNNSIYTGAEYFHNSTWGVTLTLADGSTDGLTTWGNLVVDNLTVNSSYELKVLLGTVGTSPVSRVSMIQ